MKIDMSKTLKRDDSEEKNDNGQLVDVTKQIEEFNFVIADDGSFFNETSNNDPT